MRWAGQSGKGWSIGEGGEITEDKTEKEMRRKKGRRETPSGRELHTHTHSQVRHTYTHTLVGNTAGGCLWLTGCVDVDDADCV